MTPLAARTLPDAPTPRPADHDFRAASVQDTKAQNLEKSQRDLSPTADPDHNNPDTITSSCL